MPNHFHLLVQPLDDQLSQRMQRFSISFSRAMNKRYGPAGAFFEGAFQAVPIEGDEYLRHLSRYTQLNPVEAGLVDDPEDWEYSSYRDYLGRRPGTLPATHIVLSQFPNRDAYQEFVQAYRPRYARRIGHFILDDEA
jgi:hypothetical protein